MTINKNNVVEGNETCRGTTSMMTDKVRPMKNSEKNEGKTNGRDKSRKVSLLFCAQYINSNGIGYIVNDRVVYYKKVSQRDVDILQLIAIGVATRRKTIH